MNHEHVPTGAEPADRRRVPVTGTLLALAVKPKKLLVRRNLHVQIIS